MAQKAIVHIRISSSNRWWKTAHFLDSESPLCLATASETNKLALNSHMTTLSVPVPSSSSFAEEPDTHFSISADFIPFAPASPPAFPEIEKPSRSNDRKGRDKIPVREWDNRTSHLPVHKRDENAATTDRVENQDRGQYGNKRRHDQDLDQYHGNKKQRVDIPLRKAPWVADIDWDRCKNVAEMCAPQ